MIKIRLSFYFIASLCYITPMSSQVGINTENPKTTLHVVPTKTDGTTPEGIIAPNLTRAQLIAKDGKYDSDQKGAMVYVTDISGTLTTKTAKVTSAGYYYFDGAVWQAFTGGSASSASEPWFVQGSGNQATGNTQNIYQVGQVAIGTDLSSKVANEMLNVVGTTTLFGATGIGTNPTDPFILDINGDTRAKNITMPSGYSLTMDLSDDFSYGSKKMGNYALQWSPDSWFEGGNSLWLSSYGGIKFFTVSNYRLGINSDGVLQYPNNGAAAGKLLTSDANGFATWQDAPAPWYVQNSTTKATVNTQNIYQAGNVAVGVALPNHSASETFYVGGTTMLDGATGIGRSFDTSGAFILDINGDTRTKNILMPEENVLAVNFLDAFTYDSKQMPHYGLKWTGGQSWMSAYSGMKFFTTGDYRLGITGSGDLQYPGHGAANGTVLASDDNGVATWKSPGKIAGYWFYLPSINLDMSSLSNKTVDLYNTSLKQLLSSAMGGGLPPNAGDYYYIMIGQSGHITSITIDGNGIMNYTPLTINPPATAYVNIIAVVK